MAPFCMQLRFKHGSHVIFDDFACYGSVFAFTTTEESYAK
jgi:hypothetical protein